MIFSSGFIPIALLSIRQGTDVMALLLSFTASPIFANTTVPLGIIVPLITSKNHATNNQEFYELIENPLEFEINEVENLLVSEKS